MTTRCQQSVQQNSQTSGYCAVGTYSLHGTVIWTRSAWSGFTIQLAVAIRIDIVFERVVDACVFQRLFTIPQNAATAAVDW